MSSLILETKSFIMNEIAQGNQTTPEIWNGIGYGYHQSCYGGMAVHSCLKQYSTIIDNDWDTIKVNEPLYVQCIKSAIDEYNDFVPKKETPSEPSVSEGVDI